MQDVHTYLFTLEAVPFPRIQQVCDQNDPLLAAIHVSYLLEWVRLLP